MLFGMLFHYELQRANMYVVRQRVCVCVLLFLYELLCSTVHDARICMYVYGDTLYRCSLYDITLGSTEPNRIVENVLFFFLCYSRYDAYGKNTR